VTGVWRGWLGAVSFGISIYFLTRHLCGEDFGPFSQLIATLGGVFIISLVTNNARCFARDPSSPTLNPLRRRGGTY